jgi:DNA-binding NtrC family response regulator
MTVHRDEGIAAIQASIDASAALRDELVRGEAIGHRMIAALLAGVDISDCVEAAGERPADLRQATADAHDIYRQRRHDMRALFLLAAHDSGLNDSQIARRLGVSRQSVEKSLKESGHEDPTNGERSSRLVSGGSSP